MYNIVLFSLMSAQLLFTILFGSGIQISQGSGIISIKLEHFKNPSHRAIDGQCCDGTKDAVTCTSGCDNYFILCLSSSNKSRLCDHGELWLGQGTLEDYRDDGVVFGSSIRASYPFDPIHYHENPLKRKFKRWNGTFAIKIEIFDDDHGPNPLNHNTNDKIDELHAILKVNAAKNSTTAENLTSVLTGVNVEMRISAKVWCDKYYFIPNCTEFCKDTDDSTGHYKCNYDNATKECLEGWYGGNCNTTKQGCTPRDDNYGHYECNETSGEKLCLDGWSEPALNCTKENNNGSTPTINTNATLILATKHTSRVPIQHSIPSLKSVDMVSNPKLSTKKKDEKFDSNIIVYLGGLVLFGALLVSVLVGMWKFLPKFKQHRQVAPETWQNTRRKRTISTKTGMPPVSSKGISFQAAITHGMNMESLQATRIGNKRSVVQIKSFDNGSGKGRMKTKTNANGTGQRKVTFANMGSSIV